jgi:hypothetical protein
LARLRLLNVLPCTPRSLNPRRLDIILDLELELWESGRWLKKRTAGCVEEIKAVLVSDF